MDLGYILIILAQILGLVSWILLLYSYTKEDIDDLLYIQIFVAVFDVASYLLLGADAGLLICLIELIKTVLYYKTDKDDLIFKIGVVGYCLIGLLTVRHWYACLPVIGSIVDSWGTSKDSKLANVASIVSNSLWTAYDLIILSYIGAFNDIVVVVLNIFVLIFGYSKIMRISKLRIIKFDHLTKSNVDDIYDLDVKTYGIENTWDKKYQKQVYKKNPDSFFEIAYKQSFVGYINYLNIKEEEYETLKSLKEMPSTIDLDSIIKFKHNRKSYLLIESINAKKTYEDEETIKLIDKKFCSFLRAKRNRDVYIDGVIGYAISDFENSIYKELGFKKVKELKNKVTLYELDQSGIKESLAK